MPGTRRRGMLPRRRRRDDEGEDESSTAGDLDDFSMSEGSAISNGEEEPEVEGSEVSLEEDNASASGVNTKTLRRTSSHPVELAPRSKASSGALNDKHPATDTQVNGLEHTQSGLAEEPGGVKAGELPGDTQETATSSAPQLSEVHETSAERSRREHLEYIKQRNSNPAFVPNRGGFFLHDDRSAATSSPYGRPFARGRGRGFTPGYGAGRGFNQPNVGPTDRQWAHDLHDTVNKTVRSPPPRDVPATFQIPTAKPAAIAPNRTFSVSTVLGNVSVQVFLPGMDSKKTIQNIVKKQHTLLPQHRPPLRRDKPVRISIPDEEPRYIFPSTERSFIFIPRAMRPNQQVYNRGRGRGSFHGSRRPSLMGSVYTPSVAMSRRSSLGGAGSTGINTPTDGMIPRGPMVANFNRPIVRMPIAQPVAPGMAVTSMMPGHTQGMPYPMDHANLPATILHSPTVTLPMHQPRPQKAVSVAEIESPAVKAPQQQQEQPFHQQMPPGVMLADGPGPAAQAGQGQSHVAMNTPLSHIPEGAVYAQPFQPYPVYQQASYYGPAFPGGPMMYHPPADAYGVGIGGPVLPSAYNTGQNFVPAPHPSDAGIQGGAMSHETNGMVYYYDPSQYPADATHMTQYQMAVPGGMVGVPAGPYFYTAVPGGMFYPAAQ